jgi:hypothetical protein
MTVSPSIREVTFVFLLKENHDIPHTLWNWWWWWWWWWCNLWFILLLHINSLSICLCLYGGFILHPSSSFFAHYYIGRQIFIIWALEHERHRVHVREKRLWKL